VSAVNRDHSFPPNPFVRADDRYEQDRRLEDWFDPVPYDDPAWDCDHDRWEDGPAIPADATFYLAGRAVRPQGQRRCR
jgi:hypothetical protein